PLARRGDARRARRPCLGPGRPQGTACALRLRRDNARCRAAGCPLRVGAREAHQHHRAARKNGMRGEKRLRGSIAAVERRLRAVYGQPRHLNKRDPLAELVFILLSTQTREREYQRTFAALWTKYRSWDRVRRADPRELEALIRFGGFARRKVA